MNVTVKLPDDLCREARHRAVNEDKSLSGWLADLVRRELARARPEHKTLAEILGQDDLPPEHAGKELPLEDRKSMPVREISFDDD